VSAADAITSRNLVERNPLLATDKRFSWRQATIWKGIGCGGLAIAQEWEVRKRPWHSDAWTAVMAARRNPAP
jgi:hypothetical protein